MVDLARGREGDIPRNVDTIWSIYGVALILSYTRAGSLDGVVLLLSYLREYLIMLQVNGLGTRLLYPRLRECSQFSNVVIYFLLQMS